MGNAGSEMTLTLSVSPLIFLSTRAAVETKKEQKVMSNSTRLKQNAMLNTSDACKKQSTYQAIVDIVKREGVLGLYSGLNSSLLGIAITNGSVPCLILRV